ncbi:MAG: hypothetical protein INR66_22415 [Gordonia polyisoprenivorans]|nr:hypothetical protein [Gordonia polyisoprenivorans]
MTPDEFAAVTAAESAANNALFPDPVPALAGAPFRVSMDFDRDPAERVREFTLFANTFATVIVAEHLTDGGDPRRFRVWLFVESDTLSGLGADDARSLSATLAEAASILDGLRDAGIGGDQ